MASDAPRADRVGAAIVFGALDASRGALRVVETREGLVLRQEELSGRRLVARTIPIRSGSGFRAGGVTTTEPRVCPLTLDHARVNIRRLASKEQATRPKRPNHALTR
jgi:hypothetical protein